MGGINNSYFCTFDFGIMQIELLHRGTQNFTIFETSRLFRYRFCLSRQNLQCCQIYVFGKQYPSFNFFEILNYFTFSCWLNSKNRKSKCCGVFRISLVNFSRFSGFFSFLRFFFSFKLMTQEDMENQLKKDFFSPCTDLTSLVRTPEDMENQLK